MSILRLDRSFSRDATDVDFSRAGMESAHTKRIHSQQQLFSYVQPWAGVTYEEKKGGKYGEKDLPEVNTAQGVLILTNLHIPKE